MIKPRTLSERTTRPVAHRQPMANGFAWKEEYYRLLAIERELEVSRERYALLYDSAPVGYVTLDRNGSISAINLTGTKVLGRLRENLIAFPLLSLVCKRDQHKFLRHLSAVRKGVGPLITELHFHRPGKSEMLLQLISESTSVANGHPFSIQIVFSDVTAQRRQEIELSESRAELAAVVSSTVFAIITIDLDQRIIHFNPAAEKIFCCSASEAIGQPLSRFFPVRFREAHTEHVRRFALTGQGVGGIDALDEIRGLRANGQEFPAEASISRVELPHKKLLTVILRDISRRKQAEEAWYHSTVRLKLAQDAARLGIFEWDVQSNTIRCSPLTEELYGVPPGTFQGPYENWLHAVHPEDAQRVRDEMQNLLKNQHYLETEFRITRPDSTWVRWIQSRCRVFRDAQDRRSRVIGVTFDITLRKHVEELERKGHEILERRVVERTAELARANAALREEISSRRHLQRQLLKISEREQRRIGQDLHDGLGQLLTGAALLGDVLAGKIAQNSLPDKAEARRLVQLLAESRMQARELVHGLHPVPVTADGLAVALSRLSQTISRFHGVECRFQRRGRISLPDNAVATHLFRMAQEAVHNAIQHGRSKRITVTLASHDGLLRLTVRDNGRGPCPSVSKTTSGFGLQIMGSRCEAVGASLRVRPVRPHGTLVECRMPLHPAPANSTIS